MRVLGYVGIFLCAVVLLGAGCSGRQVLNVNTLVATPKGTATEEEVLKAIQRAGLVTGWQMTPLQSGLVYAEREERGHSASVNITYSPTQYAINLASTTMMDRPSAGGYGAQVPGGGALAAAPTTVHRTYNVWVQELDKAIRAQLATLGL